MTEFYSDPWGDSVTPDLVDSYSDWSPSAVISDGPSYTETPSYVTATSGDNPNLSFNWSMPSADAIFKSVTTALDYGLKAYGQISAINNSVKDVELNNFLKKAQIDIFKTQAIGATNVNSINAKTAANIAQTRANLSNTAAVGANLGASVNNNSLMLWLTIAGVAFAFIQVVNSAK